MIYINLLLQSEYCLLPPFFPPFQFRALLLLMSFTWSEAAREEREGEWKIPIAKIRMGICALSSAAGGGDRRKRCCLHFPEKVEEFWMTHDVI